jgi:uncharacterized protein
MLVEKKLTGYMRDLGGVLVAYSGGVDSSVLAYVAHRVLGDKAVAVTFDTPTLPRHELMEAVECASLIGLRHEVVEYTELSDSSFRSNPADRCYFCKKLMADELTKSARNNSLAYVVEGTTVDELLGHRPGYRALKEAGILSPYVELGMSKYDVRCLAEKYGLRYEKPSGACLASRIPSGTVITEEILKKVEESEDYLRSLGLTQVRVRVMGDDARIETYESEFDKVVDNADEIRQALPFRRVVLDLRGYS